MEITGLTHIGVRVLDMARATAFYMEVVGLEPRPEKANWLDAGGVYSVHLMPASGPDAASPNLADFATRVAFEVPDLRATTAHLLKAGCSPYQLALDMQRHEVATTDDPLNFGIGTIFVEDTEGNHLEFVQFGHGSLFSSHEVHRARRPPGERRTATSPPGNA